MHVNKTNNERKSFFRVLSHDKLKVRGTHIPTRSSLDSIHQTDILLSQDISLFLYEISRWNVHKSQSVFNCLLSVCSLHFTHSLHFTPGTHILQSAVCVLHWPISKTAKKLSCIVLFFNVSFLSNNIIICHDCASRCRRKWRGTWGFTVLRYWAFFHAVFR